MKNITAAEKKISAFCARRQIAYEWQALRFDGRRAVILCVDLLQYQEITRAARRLRGVEVTTWIAPGPGCFDGCVYLQDAADAERIRAAADAESRRSWAWWQVRHDAIASGLDPAAAVRLAESAYPTPAI